MTWPWNLGLASFLRDSSSLLDYVRVISTPIIIIIIIQADWCPTLSNPVLWKSWMSAYLGYTLQKKTLFPGWPIMVHDTHIRKRRLKKVPFDRSNATFYWLSIVTIALSCTIFELFDVKYRDLEIWVRGHSRTVSYSQFILTMALSLAICEISSVKEWHYLENWVMGRSRSFKM